MYTIMYSVYYKLSTTIMDNANGDKEITSLLVNKYETLYSSVPTDDNEMN